MQWCKQKPELHYALSYQTNAGLRHLKTEFSAAERILKLFKLRTEAKNEHLSSQRHRDPLKSSFWPESWFNIVTLQPDKLIKVFIEGILMLIGQCSLHRTNEGKRNSPSFQLNHPSLTFYLEGHSVSDKAKSFGNYWPFGGFRLKLGITKTWLLHFLCPWVMFHFLPRNLVKEWHTATKYRNKRRKERKQPTARLWQQCNDVSELQPCELTNSWTASRAGVLWKAFLEICDYWILNIKAGKRYLKTHWKPSLANKQRALASVDQTLCLCLCR